MARELAPAREGLRVRVFLNLKRVKYEDLPALIKHLDGMKAEWGLTYEINQNPEADLPEGA